MGAAADHRWHAIIEQVLANLKSEPMANAPSGNFIAYWQWLTLAAMAFNSTRGVVVAAGGGTAERLSRPFALS